MSIDTERIHPEPARIEELVGGTLGAAEQAKTEAHLRACAHCRTVQEDWAEIKDLVTVLPTAAVSAQLRARIVRDATIRIRIAQVPSRRRSDMARRGAWVTLAMAAGVACLIVLGRSVRVAGASDTLGRLTIAPTIPRIGEDVNLTYRPSVLLGSSDDLIVRGRLRSASATVYDRALPVVQLAHLRRGSDGLYHGSVRLPDSVVFASLAVEDVRGRAVDDHEGETWMVLQASADGRPTFDALLQRNNDLTGRSWEGGLANAQEMVRLYPDSVKAWDLLHAFEGWLGLTNDSLTDLHRRALSRITQNARRRGSAGKADYGPLYWYAQGIGEASEAAYWRRLLLTETPNADFAIQERMLAATAAMRSRTDTIAALDSLDALWKMASGRRRIHVASTAMRVVPREEAFGEVLLSWTARATGDTNSLPARAAQATAMLNLQSLRARGMALLDSVATVSANVQAHARALSEDSTEFRTRIARLRQDLDRQRGRALLQAGDTARGTDVLERVIAEGWAPDAASMLAKVHAQHGDTAGALPYWAQLTIDPRLATQVRHLDTLGLRFVGKVRWRAMESDARKRLVAWTLADARPRRVADSRILDSTAHGRSLSEITRDSISIVLFWSEKCAPAIVALQRLQEKVDSLRSLGVRVIAITEPSSSDSTVARIRRENKLTMPFYSDSAGSAARAFNTWGTPSLYLFDKDGRVLFRVTSSVSEVAFRASVVAMRDAWRLE